MKKLIALLFVLGVAFAPLAATAAECTQGGVTVRGDFCGIVDGSCVCSDFEK